MLRFLVLLLVLANAGYFVWSQGWLRDFGLAPVRQSEPQRMAQQIRPEALVVAPAGSATAETDAPQPGAAQPAPEDALPKKGPESPAAAAPAQNGGSALPGASSAPAAAGSVSATPAPGPTSTSNDATAPSTAGNGGNASAPAGAPVAAAVVPPTAAVQAAATLPASAASVAAAATAPGSEPQPSCLQAGLFDEVQATALAGALGVALPKGRWRLEAARQDARWIVFLGKYLHAWTLARKEAELRRRDVPFRTLGEPIGPGLSLGGFDSEAAAAEHLKLLNERGVTSAKVVQQRAEGSGQRLILPNVDGPLRERLPAIQEALVGKPLLPCELAPQRE